MDISRDDTPTSIVSPDISQLYEYSVLKASRRDALVEYE